MIYVDSSVALAHLLLEPRLPPPSLWDRPLVSSRLLEYEVWNRLHARGLGRSHREAAMMVIGRVEFVGLTSVALELALQPFPVPIKTLDALHLATVEFLRGRGDPVELATYDNRLIAAAKALGTPIAAL